MTKQGKCCLCGAECEMGMEIGKNVPWDDYECDYCGRYRISGTTKDACEDDDTKRHKAACVLAERHLKKMGKCRIHTVLFDDNSPSDVPTVTLDSLIDSYPPSPLDVLDRSLLNLSRMIDPSDGKIKFAMSHPTVLFSGTEQKLLYVIDQFHKLGYIDLGGNISQQVVHSPGINPIARHLLENGFYHYSAK